MPVSGPVYAARRTARCSEIDCREGRFGLTQWGPPGESPIVLLHGWMDCGAAWQLLVDELPDDWPLLAIDWRGYGRSAPRDGRYYFPEHLAELDALLDLLVPAGPVRLIGHSLGGTVATLYAAARPRRIAWLVNIEGYGMPEPPAGGLPQQLAAWLDALRAPPVQRRYASPDELALLLCQRNPALPPAHALFLATVWTRSVAGGHEMLADARHQLFAPIRYTRAQIDACLAQVSAPMLLLQGADSGYLLRAAGAGALARWQQANAALQSRTIAAAGHLLPYEQPAAAAQAITHFAACNP